MRRPQPKVRKQKKTHGFLARSRSKSKKSKLILVRRRRAGRKKLTV